MEVSANIHNIDVAPKKFFLFALSLQADNPIIEIPDIDLDMKYVKDNVLTNTDKFLESYVNGGRHISIAS